MGRGSRGGGAGGAGPSPIPSRSQAAHPARSPGTSPGGAPGPPQTPDPVWEGSAGPSAHARSGGAKSEGWLEYEGNDKEVDRSLILPARAPLPFTVPLYLLLFCLGNHIPPLIPLPSLLRELRAC